MHHMLRMPSFVLDAVYAHLSHAPFSLQASVFDTVCAHLAVFTPRFWLAPGVQHKHLHVAHMSPVMPGFCTHQRGDVHVTSESCTDWLAHGSIKQ